MNRQQRALNHYNRLNQMGQWNFVDFDVSSLPLSTQKYYMMWIDHFGRSAKLHQPIVEDTYVFLINHPVVKYLLHDAKTESHMWGDKDFENIDGNLALALMAGGAGPNIGPDTLKDIFDAVDEADGME